MIAGEGEQARLLGEDYSFCERASRCGFRVMADTSIRLWSVGSYRYGWEDAGRDVERFTDYTFEVTDTIPVGGPSLRGPPRPLRWASKTRPTLRRLRRELELGTGLGRSTVCLAQQARQVLTIDRQDQTEAREWCRRYQVHDRVVFRQGEFERISPRLEERFELIFVGTEPDESSMRRVIETALPRLARDGLLALPNYPDPRWPQVRRVVDKYAGRLGWRRLAQADFLGIFRSAGF